MLFSFLKGKLDLMCSFIASNEVSVAHLKNSAEFLQLVHIVAAMLSERCVQFVLWYLNIPFTQ